MRFSVQLPTDRVENGDEFTSVEAIRELACAAEDAGFDACYVTEHPFPTQEWLDSGGHHALDPFVVLAAAAAATSRLRLHTNILVLPYRNPFLTAKALASLDVLSGGRVIAGIAVGYLEGEYRALGADFQQRNQLADEALVAMKAAWTGELVERSGHAWEAAGNRMLPRPLQRPHPPIWVGGNSRRAMRRAAEHGQGWSPFPLPAEYAARTRSGAIENLPELAERIRWLQDHAREIGRRDPLDVNFVPFGLGMNRRKPLDVHAIREQVGQLGEAGVSWLSVGLPGRTRSQYCQDLSLFGQQVIAGSRR